MATFIGELTANVDPDEQNNCLPLSFTGSLLLLILLSVILALSRNSLLEPGPFFVLIEYRPSWIVLLLPKLG